jgi:hypothetical protein
MSTHVVRAPALAQPDARRQATPGQWLALAGGVLFTAIPLVWWPLCDALTAGMPYTDPPTPAMMRLHALRHLLEVPAPALLAAGLIGIYRRYRRELGPLGQAGLALVVFGLLLRAALALGIVLTDGITSTHIEVFELVHPSPVVAVLGSLVFGFAALRTSSLSRTGSLLVLASAIALLVELGAVGFAEGAAWLIAEALMALNGLGYALLGYRFWRDR